MHHQTNVGRLPKHWFRIPMNSMLENIPQASRPGFLNAHRRLWFHFEYSGGTLFTYYLFTYDGAFIFQDTKDEKGFCKNSWWLLVLWTSFKNLIKRQPSRLQRDEQTKMVAEEPHLHSIHVNDSSGDWSMVENRWSKQMCASIDSIDSDPKVVA